tara:strand:+ start:1465 stop:1722 length:258 start_codon:yes stop_codon:yes gene_type:complete
MPQTDLKKAHKKAKIIGVTIKPSKLKNKKIDVFKNGEKIASIGDIRYSDFNLHNDKQRRKNYKSRHEKHRNKIGTPSYYADKILW